MLQTNDYILKEQETIERFLQSDLNKAPYSVELNVRWHTQYTVTYFDIFIKYNNIPFSVVVFILAPDHGRSVEFAKRQIDNAFHFTDCHFGIITDHNEFYLCNKNNKEYQKHDINDIIALLLCHNLQQNSDNDNTISPHKDLYDILKNRGNKDFIESLRENNGKYYFYNDDDESCFWHKLLNDRVYKQDTIYRYTSLDTAFWILKNRTYRMYGIVGMNDKSEVDYVDNYCSIKDKKLSYRVLNDLFLSSCTSSNDNLTMWRLYGNDAKGACLVFEIKSDSQKDFHIQAVSYANDQGKDSKLDIIKDLNNRDVVFQDIDKWKHFFKSKDYSVEHEVRLLIQNKGQSKRDWIVSNDNSIITPFVEFNIFDDPGFPLVLKEIILGPKCPEQETNKYQLQELIQQNNLSVIVRASEIKNYR